MTTYGRFEVCKSHVLCPSAGAGFSQSPYLIDLALYVGQELTFADGEECLEKLGNIHIGAKQIERLCHHYGGLLEDLPLADESASGSAEDLRYVMMDGSMVLSRESGWTEVKLARVFRPDSVIGVGKTRQWVRQSQYMAYVGDSSGFLEKLDRLISPYRHKVFVADGARWIWKYVEEHHPDSVQILDYYHAAEYLHRFASDHFAQKDQRQEFTQTCIELLNGDRVADVVMNVQAIKPCERSKESHEKLLSYYQNNQDRMMYSTFRKKGYAIGSGAMEAAHRTVIQERAKRSGQRWTKEGVQQVVNLRVAHQSNQWSIITNILRNAA